jgi:phage gp45-like
MMDSEQIRFIREEVKRQLNVVLNAEVGETTTDSETINKLFPGGPSITARPVAHPWGFVSRAVQGTISVVAKVGADIHNRMVIGHRDSGRPTDLEEGETCLYSSSGYRVVWRQGMILIGKGDDLEPAVMGTTLNEFLSQLVELIVEHTHAAPGAPPTNQADFTELKTNFLDNDKILSEDGGRF